MKILVSDKLSAEGVAVLEKAEGFDVDVRTGLDESALCAIIGDYDGLIIRSATRVTPTLLACADKLKMVGRAGIGVDNIDLLEASRRGIVVMNAPFGNAVTTAEHALGLLATLTRHVAAADASMKAGKWEKAKVRGTEKWKKT
ncbi:MAG: D-3-phosphoglycerate dehydrogenase, partial [Polyangiales bacterium]